MDNTNLVNLKSDHSEIYLIIFALLVGIIIYFVFFSHKNKHHVKNEHPEKFGDAKSEQILTDLFNENVNLHSEIYDQKKKINSGFDKNYLASQYKEVTQNDNITIDTSESVSLDDKTLVDMNAVGEKSKGDVSCNLLGLNDEHMNDFKKKYYSMYSHQIKCPKKSHMNVTGTKKCNLENDSECNQVFTSEFNNNDTNALNYYKLITNNKKDCVTCTEKPLENHLSRFKTGYDFIPESVIKTDSERIEKKKVTFGNVDSFVKFNDKHYQNSIGETPVDRMAEIKTCENGTCGLSSYGTSIHNVYDKLVSSSSSNYKKACNPDLITGVMENPSMTNEYEQV